VTQVSFERQGNSISLLLTLLPTFKTGSY
jgi:hypothetical protein